MIASTPPCSALENPLWQFSLVFYRQPLVADFLLECQDDKGADVCLLLWASYVSMSGRQLGEAAWREADHGLRLRRWIIHGVRHLRRWLSGMRWGTAAYEWCKHYELSMEQRQLALLWKLNSEHWPGDRLPLELAGQQYGLSQQTKARWTSLLAAYQRRSLIMADHK